MKPVVVVTRHPDYDDTISLHGLPDDTRVVYLDLGRSFDVDSGQGDTDDVREWVASVFAERDTLPEDHPARAEVEAVVAYALEELDLTLDAVQDSAGA